ncbi:MAG: hypothetical protein AAGF45_07695 [Pseudomonadota bacterium]
MLAFIDVAGTCARPFNGLVRALGKDAVVWCETPADVKNAPTRAPGVRAIAGRLQLDWVLANENVTAIALCAGNPLHRVLAAWFEAGATPTHPFHDAPHTFTLREVLEEDHPFARALCNAVSNALCQAGAEPSVAHVLARLSEGKTVVGDPARPGPFITALAHLLQAPRTSFQREDFAQNHFEPVRGRLAKMIRERNEMDAAICNELSARSDGTTRVLRLP